MNEPDHLPNVDLDFIVNRLSQCDKVIPGSQYRVGGNVVTFVLKGNKPMYKRNIVIQHSNGVVNFNQATSLAIKYQFMGALLEWLRDNRAWKEGAYVVQESAEEINPDE